MEESCNVRCDPAICNADSRQQFASVDKNHYKIHYYAPINRWTSKHWVNIIPRRSSSKLQADKVHPACNKCNSVLSPTWTAMNSRSERINRMMPSYQMNNISQWTFELIHNNDKTATVTRNMSIPPLSILCTTGLYAIVKTLPKTDFITASDQEAASDCSNQFIICVRWYWYFFSFFYISGSINP
jgi:hypothetical protein